MEMLYPTFVRLCLMEIVMYYIYRKGDFMYTVFIIGSLRGYTMGLRIEFYNKRSTCYVYTDTRADCSKVRVSRLQSLKKRRCNRVTRIITHSMRYFMLIGIV